MSDSVTPSVYRSASPASDRRDEHPNALVVEDHADTRELLAFLLENLGYAVLEATDGIEALRLATDTPFDLVLTDLGLPDISGLEVVRQLRTLRRDFSDLKIVMLSAYSGDEYVNAAFDAGCDIVLTKPVDVEKLLWIIGSLGQTADSKLASEYSH